MTKDQLKKLLSEISGIKIAVIGDFCLDAYWFIDQSASEISIETGQETRPVYEQRYSLGGAGNVTSNLAAMGAGEVLAFGVIGTDPFGREMLRIMEKTGINTRNMLIQEDQWHTHTYSKPYIGENELGRIDFGNFNKLSSETAGLLIQRLTETIPLVDLVIVNQQVPSGIHTEYFRKNLVEIIGMFPERIFVADSRNFNNFFTGSVRKMNDTEALRLCGQQKDPGDPISLRELEQPALELFSRYGKPLFITRGAKGSIIVESGKIKEIPGLMILERTDTVGAGDSYLAGAASALAAGRDMAEAAYLGTLVAGVTVRKLFQTGTASPEEIIAAGTDPDMIYSPDLAENIRHARYLDGSGIEIINPWQGKLKISHAIFDHDGTVSTLREGWEKIMEPVMIKAILGERLSDADDALFKKVKERVDEFIDKTTGIQTIAQMTGLLGLIREFGIVPENKMLDARGYKKLFNTELLRMVNARANRFMSRELDIPELTITGVIDLIEKLFNKGIRLYLASGTDEEDVILEAKTLGYAELFEGGIFGSVGDIKMDAKKKVLDQIFDTIGTDTRRLLTFGDGPVEIRETRKRGGLTVGVASDEVRRYGLNEHKRTRLVKAGADIIIPDFSQHRLLLEMLNI
jgi:rfaE bifunctional protein kinase chain/domain